MMQVKDFLEEAVGEERTVEDELVHIGRWTVRNFALTFVWMDRVLAVVLGLDLEALYHERTISIPHGLMKVGHGQGIHSS